MRVTIMYIKKTYFFGFFWVNSSLSALIWTETLQTWQPEGE